MIETDEIGLGPVPSEESAAQVGQPDFAAQAQRECQVMCRMLRRLFPNEVEALEDLRPKRFGHDFGSYFDVVACYDPENADATAAACFLEANVPEHWDSVARYELLWYADKAGLPKLAAANSGQLPDWVPDHMKEAQPPVLDATQTLAGLLAQFPLRLPQNPSRESRRACRRTPVKEIKTGA